MDTADEDELCGFDCSKYCMYDEINNQEQIDKIQYVSK
jgi:hypothetical protein